MIQSVDILILGGGLSGIACSYFIGHQRCLVIEKNDYLGGHIHSHQENGFTWDEGPHVSFTTNARAKDIFEVSSGGKFLEYPVEATNYFNGRWIPHPAQSNLYAADAQTREACLSDFLESRSATEANEKPDTYREWLLQAFGEHFAQTFPEAYTEKYWTTVSKNLACDWVGERVFYPKIEDFVEGCERPLETQTHYIKYVRYPQDGGYFSFCSGMVEGINSRRGEFVTNIDLIGKSVTLESGITIFYNRLINTLPLPIFVDLINAPPSVRAAADQLSCSSVLLINVEADHPTTRKENWIYVYDRDKLSTRINCTELLSPNNAPSGKSGVQVEVYFSPYRPYLVKEHDRIVAQVEEELIEMGLVRSRTHILRTHSNYVQWANVIFDHSRVAAQETILDYLSNRGLVRETDDLHPMTNWDDARQGDKHFGELILAGRFAQWKYFWTDDCVLRGDQIGRVSSHVHSNPTFLEYETR